MPGIQFPTVSQKDFAVGRWGGSLALKCLHKVYLWSLILWIKAHNPKGNAEWSLLIISSPPKKQSIKGQVGMSG